MLSPLDSLGLVREPITTFFDYKSALTWKKKWAIKKTENSRPGDIFKMGGSLSVAEAKRQEEESKCRPPKCS